MLSIVLSLLIKFAFNVANASNLRHNPRELRKLFLEEFEIRSILTNLSPHMLKDATLSVEIEKFLYSHDSVINTLKDYGMRMHKDIQGMEDIIDNHLSGNIVHLFSMFRRCLFSVDKILELLKKGEDIYGDEVEFDRALDKLNSILENISWPNQMDLDVLSLSLARIQRIYRLQASDLVRGKIGQRETSAKLMPEDTLHLANDRLEGLLPLFGKVVKRYNYGMEDETYYEGKREKPEYALAIEWLEAGFEISVEQFDEDEEITRKILDKLVKTRAKHDFEFVPREIDKKLVDNFLVRQLGRDLHVTARQLRLEEFHSGEMLPREEVFAECRREVNIEVLAEKPRVTLIHDLLRKNEVELMRHIGLTSDLLKPSEVLAGYQIHVRTQASGFLSQIGMYIPGGMYRPHLDAILNDKSRDYKDITDITEGDVLHPSYSGDRIATVLFYLSEVDAGHTVFTKIDAFAKPKEGSALFWYNLLPNRRDDLETNHGGCPTLYGIKWVSNKWIREAAQMFRKPCPLHKELIYR